MAEAAAHRAHRYAGGQQLGGVQVAQIVEPYARDAEAITQVAESAGEAVGVRRRAAIRVGAEHVRVRSQRTVERLGTLLHRLPVP